MRSLRVAVLAGVLILAAAACGGDEGGGDTGGGASATTAASGGGGGGGEELKLTAKDIKWDTTTLQLTSGTSYRVEVTNDDTVEHNFTFAEASANQDVEGGENATVNLTAPAAGSYEFFCKYHQQGMRGTVTVT